MSDDDDIEERTIMDTVRYAARGKVSRSGRREADRLNLKDWAGYVLAVVMPVAGVLWATHQSVTRMEVRVERLEREVEKDESKRERIWQRLGDHLEGHP